MEAAFCSSVALPVVCNLIEETQAVDLQATVRCSIVKLISVFDSAEETLIDELQIFAGDSV